MLVHISDIQTTQKQQPVKPVTSGQKEPRKPSLKGKIQHSTELMSESEDCSDEYSYTGESEVPQEQKESGKKSVTPQLLKKQLIDMGSDIEPPKPPKTGVSLDYFFLYSLFIHVDEKEMYNILWIKLCTSQVAWKMVL